MAEKHDRPAVTHASALVQKKQNYYYYSAFCIALKLLANKPSYICILGIKEKLLICY